MKRLNNFWTKKTIECGLSLKDVAKIMEVSVSTAHGYLSGLCRPPKDKVEAICSHCDVDVIEGAHEFNKEYNLWESRHPGCVRSGNSYMRADTAKARGKRVPLYTPELAADSRKKRCDAGVSITLGDTFWGKVRATKKVSFKELAKQLNTPLTTTRSYFTGRMIPTPEIATKICDFYGVNLDEGFAEFNKLHKSYWEDHRTKEKQRKTQVSAAFEKAVAALEAGEPIYVAPVTTTGPAPEGSKAPVDFLEVLYGKIPFSAFQLIYSSGKSAEDVLPIIYGVVDYVTYQQVAATL